jgi:hypothetical protein
MTDPTYQTTDPTYQTTYQATPTTYDSAGSTYQSTTYPSTSTTYPSTTYPSTSTTYPSTTYPTYQTTYQATPTTYDSAGSTYQSTTYPSTSTTYPSTGSTYQTPGRQLDAIIDSETNNAIFAYMRSSERGAALLNTINQSGNQLTFRWGSTDSHFQGVIHINRSHDIRSIPPIASHEIVHAYAYFNGTAARCDTMQRNDFIRTSVEEEVGAHAMSYLVHWQARSDLPPQALYEEFRGYMRRRHASEWNNRNDWRPVGQRAKNFVRLYIDRGELSPAPGIPSSTYYASAYDSYWRQNGYAAAANPNFLRVPVRAVRPVSQDGLSRRSGSRAPRRSTPPVPRPPQAGQSPAR